MATETQLPQHTSTEETQIVEKAEEPSELLPVKDSEEVVLKVAEEVISTEKTEIPQPLPPDVEGVKTSISTAEVTAKNVEQVFESKIAEGVKDEKSIEAITTTVKEAVAESKEPATELKDEPSETEKVSEVPNLETSTKDGDGKKMSQEEPKEIPAKSKQSYNIILKVKQSLVKAKKAITGKSKNQSKVDVNVK